MMKNLILTFMAFVLAINVNYAQEDLSGLNGKKALKKASRLLSAYNLDQVNSGDKLLEAKTVIDHAVKQDDIKMDPKVWITMGDIYNAFVSYNAGQKVINPDFTDIEPNGGMAAFMAYKKALELEDGNKQALRGITDAIGSISNTGLTNYESGDYLGAFNSFRSVLDIHDLLKKYGEESPLDIEEEYNNQVYITGLSALSAGQNETAKAYMKQLYDKDYDKPGVYDAMYKLTIDDDVDAAEAILNRAREKYPDDLGLLFSEINHYLKLEKIDVLEDKLKFAIEKEPDNHSLHSTLGNIYDRQYQDAYAAGNMEEANEYFSNAKEYYENAVEIKSDYTDGIYSIGALYYNKAALVTEEMNALANDYSKEGTAKYEKLKVEVEELFDTALPYFKQVEKIDPSDRNTLIALKEIFARKNDFETSSAFKDRLAKVEAGETIDQSYFQD